MYLWRYDHVCITLKYDFIVNMSCKYMCHVVKGLIYFGIATIKLPKELNINISHKWVSCQVNFALQI